MTDLLSPAPPTAIVPAAPGRVAGRCRTVAQLVGRGVSSLALLGAGVLFLGFAVGPHLFDYRTVTMRSASMAPAVEAGDVLVLRPEPVSEVAVGQLLTFAAPVAGNPVHTHRVVSVDRQEGTTVVTTKGDANAEPDPWKAELEGTTAWHTVAVVPVLGWVFGALHHPVVHVVTVWLLPGALCLHFLLRLWRSPGRITQPRSPAQQTAPVA